MIASNNTKPKITYSIKWTGKNKPDNIFGTLIQFIIGNAKNERQSPYRSNMKIQEWNYRWDTYKILNINKKNKNTKCLNPFQTFKDHKPTHTWAIWTKLVS